tara:strand:+ start:129 stop:605 length:477 start_codon:yes stop_codon:yes gene_type:complete
MNNIVAYNSILLKYIIAVSALILIIIVGYKLWDDNRIKPKKKKGKEHFSQITLEKQVRLYDDYRNYINGKDYLTSRFNKGKRVIPYVVSPKCFVDKYKHCLKDRELYNYPHPPGHPQPLGSSDNEYHTNYYPVGFRQASYTCEDKSYDECLTDNFSLL